jgi:hypothetical protein
MSKGKHEKEFVLRRCLGILTAIIFSFANLTATNVK